jgi:radical SAM protein with 4Fe4S-binding SPASM domain
MILSIILGVLIFGYGAYMFYKFIQKSRQGKCGTCALNKSCESGCSTVSPKERLELLKEENH